MLRRTERTGLLSTGLQAAANIATLIAACLLSIVLVKTYFLSGRTPRPIAPAYVKAAVGYDLKSKLPGVDWSSNRETVLLALSTHCHFCTDSAPFFRKLSDKSGKTFKIVAVLPESVTEAQEYLEREGVHVDQLKQLALDRLAIDGTPTMLLVDSRGMVTESWIGMLEPEAQNQALRVIGASQAQKAGDRL